jgi:hypothetical protein
MLALLADGYIIKTGFNPFIFAPFTLTLVASYGCCQGKRLNSSTANSLEESTNTPEKVT